MRVIHLASFNGNVGDHINHRGFWEYFKKNIDSDIEVTKIEIREFYKSWGLRKFDDSFVEFVNSFDLFVVGGGNFFDIKWAYSRTGTTLDLPEELLSKIKVPIIFNGLGVDIASITTNDEIFKFEKFLNYCNKKNNIVLSVRNDGSKELLEHYFSSTLTEKIIEIPDGGFFTSSASYYHPEIKADAINIAINIAKDSVNVRWPNPSFDYDLFCKDFARFLDKSIYKYENLHYIFVAHIPSDIVAIGDVLNNVNDIICRNNISIAPFLNGDTTNGDYIIDLYKNVKCSIAMRYHSNICSIAMGTPTIGIVTFQKHKELYKKIGLENRLFDVSSGEFSEKLLDRLNFVLSNYSLLQVENSNLVRSLDKSLSKYTAMIKNIIRSNA